MKDNHFFTIALQCLYSYYENIVPDKGKFSTPDTAYNTFAKAFMENKGKYINTDIDHYSLMLTTILLYFKFAGTETLSLIIEEMSSDVSQNKLSEIEYLRMCNTIKMLHELSENVDEIGKKIIAPIKYIEEDDSFLFYVVEDFKNLNLLDKFIIRLAKNTDYLTT